MFVEISKLNTDWKIRSVKDSGVNALKSKLENGFLDSFPIIIDENLMVIDGHHRVEAASQLGIAEVPCIVKDGISESEKIHLAFMANEASETSVPMTMVDYCEFIWSSEDKLAEIAIQLGWSLGKVQQHSALKKLTQKAWAIILTSFDDVSEELTFVSFSEGLLRPLIKLKPYQQLELVQDLAEGEINKNKFKKLAEKYKQQNEDVRTAFNELCEYPVSLKLIKEAIHTIRTGTYSLDALIQAKKDKQDEIESIKLIHGDFYEEVKKVLDGSIDLIITDPPYNIAHDNDRKYDDRKDVSMDFGEWDKVDHSEFKKMILTWAEEFKRILKPSGSGYMFTSDKYISHIREYLEEAGLRYRATIVWHKTNPGTSATKQNFISSNEFIIYFDNGEKPTLNWMGENEMQNFIQSPVCGGDERVKDSKGNTMHPTQKPMKVIRHLLDISSNIGDTVFDGFMGSGTTAEVCKKQDRKFIGIEFDEKYFKAAQKRSL